MKLAIRISVLLLVAAPAVVAGYRLSRGCRGALIPRPAPGEWIGATDLDRPVPMTFAMPGGAYSLFLNSLALRIDCVPDSRGLPEPRCSLRLPEACASPSVPLRDPVPSDGGDARLRNDARRGELVLAGRNTWHASFRIVPPGILAFGWPRIVTWLVALVLSALAASMRRMRSPLVLIAVVASAGVLVSLWV